MVTFVFTPLIPVQARADFSGKLLSGLVFDYRWKILTRKAPKFHNMKRPIVEEKYTSWMVHEVSYSNHFMRPAVFSVNREF